MSHKIQNTFFFNSDFIVLYLLSWNNELIIKIKTWRVKKDGLMLCKNVKVQKLKKICQTRFYYEYANINFLSSSGIPSVLREFMGIFPMKNRISSRYVFVRLFCWNWNFTVSNIEKLRKGWLLRMPKPRN